jgi:hypothetical protein
LRFLCGLEFPPQNVTDSKAKVCSKGVDDSAASNIVHVQEAIHNDFIERIPDDLDDRHDKEFQRADSAKNGPKSDED